MTCALRDVLASLFKGGPENQFKVLEKIIFFILPLKGYLNIFFQFFVLILNKSIYTRRNIFYFISKLLYFLEIIEFLNFRILKLVTL